jgi:hypothetical protein
LHASRRIWWHYRRFRIQDFVHNVREPIQASALIFRFKSGQKQFGEQVEAAGVIIAEGAGDIGEGLKHAQASVLPAQRNQHGGAGPDLPGEVELDASVYGAVVATEDSPGIEAILKELRFARQWCAAFAAERTGCGAANQLRSFFERNQYGISLGDRQRAVADQLQHFIEDEAFGLKQINIRG